MTLNIISADAVLYTGNVSSVTLPGTQGEFTVLQNHASLLSTLTAGTVRCVNANGQQESVSISGGVVDVDNNIVSVCVY